MFAPADWEEDVPKNVPDFDKKTKHKLKLKKDCQEPSLKRKKNAFRNQPMADTEYNSTKNKNKHAMKIKNSTSETLFSKDTDASKCHKTTRKRKKSASNYCDDDIDEKIISDKKKNMFDHTTKPKEIEEMLFESSAKQRKKEKFKKLLETHVHRRPIISSGNLLRERMMQRLNAARFRYLNEKLYLSESKEARELFKSDPTSFKIYHDGFRQQIKKWPINPLEVIIKKISKMPKETKVADMGCGEGALAKRVVQKVRSFDLVSATEGVEECDMAHTPLKNAEMDVAVYCLALMGTNLKDYLIEANRILKVGGLMKIAEVESRFKTVEDFIKAVESYGFKLTSFDDSKKVFYFFDFKKERNLGQKKNKLPNIVLDPCLYKKR